MKIRRRSHPRNHEPLTSKKEDRHHVKRMGRNFPATLYNHEGIARHAAYFNGKKHVYVDFPF